MITPWEVEGLIDYKKLMEDFGMDSFEKILDKIKDPHRLMRRKIIFGHREYERILNAMERDGNFVVMSGFMPSGLPHIGHKMTMEEIVWHQKKGAKAFVAIADIEAHVVRNVSWEKTDEIGMMYVKSLIALGLEEDAVIYFQSASNHVKDLAMELAKEVNFSELKAVYGFESETSLAKMFVTVIQAADILHPQLKDFGGPKPVVVPVGADQDPHIRLTRDLAAKSNIFSFEKIEGGIRVRSRKGSEYLKKLNSLNFEMKKFEEHIDIFGDENEVEKAVRSLEVELGGYAFIPPSSIYHKFVTGLRGGKMSSSKPESYISLFEDLKLVEKKIMNALTGGRATSEEQRRLGGEPEKCVIFELYTYHLVENDRELKRIEEDCRSGKILCGRCKKVALEMMLEFLKDFREKMDEIEKEIDLYRIIKR
ncbi:MAG: tryptophan--tRNA ligase [Archaeoglobaceae archaeon]|nr:tryptophan--tRNA ligase [Archaeoglobaceae archaeon]MDW8013844.1 tryptophan--tRNA ligase [Archaeoglobaceae archaeon]